MMEVVGIKASQGAGHPRPRPGPQRVAATAAPLERLVLRYLGSGGGMTRGRLPSPKEALMTWVDLQHQLDPRTKFILHRLALYADANCQAWSKVDTLADATNSSRRTVFNVLRALEADGLIRQTGEMHTLNPGSRYPRRVPFYQLAAGVEGCDPLAASGANIAPQPDGSGAETEALGCKIERAQVQLSAPRNENSGTEISYEIRAREAEELFERLEAAFCVKGLGFTRRDVARAEFLTLLESGSTAEQLIFAGRAVSGRPRGPPARRRAGPVAARSPVPRLADGARA
jgi:hypothetical protein